MTEARRGPKYWAIGSVVVMVVLVLTWLSWVMISGHATQAERLPPHGGPGQHAHDLREPGGDANFFDNLLKVYMPRRACMDYEPELIWLHFVSDLLIAAAYYSIPLALIYFVRRRRDIAFGWIFWMFAAFILACGTTHLFGVIDLWQPFYRLEGIVKLFTGVISIATAIVLWPLIPKALALPSPAQLEARVRQRTAELVSANDILKDEMQARRTAEMAQARLAAIVESSDDAIVGKTLEGIITSWNLGAERIFGYKAEEMIGESIYKIFPPERRHEEPMILGRLSRGDTITHFETQRLRNDGRYIDVSITASPIRDREGRLIGISKIARDITQQKRIQREREQLLDSERAARADAERAGRMKEEFLATVSHELRTPLNAIMGWSQLLRRDSANPETRDQGLEVIERNARIQAQLISELLDVSRIITGKLRLDVQRVDPISFIEAAIETVGPAAEAKSIRLVKVLDPKAGPVTGDPGRLQQVMWNLLTNAIKFTPKGGRVEVRLERINSHIEIAVSDTGEGIPSDFLPHIFEKFRQKDAASTRKHGGLGLGLALVKDLVEMHGGSVRALSAGEGQGTAFIITLPLRVVEPGEQGREHPSYPAVIGERVLPRLDGLKVLVVDDEPDARDLVKRFLEDAGAVVQLAVSGTHGLELVKVFAAHVIISDIGMPDTDGYAFMRSVRQEGATTPALALTAFARAEDRLKALQAGYQLHLSKPIDPAELVISVASLAGRLSP